MRLFWPISAEIRVGFNGGRRGDCDEEGKRAETVREGWISIYTTSLGYIPRTVDYCIAFIIPSI